MAGGLFKKHPVTGALLLTPIRQFKRCGCCNGYSRAEPCGNDYEGPDVYFNPAKAPACGYIWVNAADRCFRVSAFADQHTPAPGDIYVELGGATLYTNCCDCDEENCASTRTDPLLSIICPANLPSFDPCCCVADGTVVSGSGQFVEHIWRGSSELIREVINTTTWSWSFTVGSPGSATSTWTRVNEQLQRVSPGVYQWFTTTDGPNSLSVANQACPLEAEIPSELEDPSSTYWCYGPPSDTTQNYTEDFDCTGYHGTAHSESGTQDHSCGTGICGRTYDWELTITATDINVPSQCTGGCP